MKHLTGILILLFAALLLVGETQVSISASANLATVGDRINLKILAKTSEPVDDIKISSEQKIFEIIEEKEIKEIKEKEYRVFEKNIVIAFFATGDFEIEPFNVEFIKAGEIVAARTTNSIPITVKSVLTEEDKDIKPIKDPFDLRGNPFFILKYVLILLALVVLGILIYYWLKRRAKKAKIPETILPPIAEFQDALAKLLGRGLFEKERHKEFFLQLTVLTKRLINRNYLFNAEDLTTYETMYQLKTKEDDGQILENLRFTFKLADLVKFAKVIPEQNNINKMLSKIDEMIAILKKREEVVENPHDTLRE